MRPNRLLTIFRTAVAFSLGLALLAHCADAQGINDERTQTFDAGNILKIEGQIEFLADPPKSVCLGKLQSDTTIFMFAEKKSVVLPTDMNADITKPGDYKNKRMPRDKIDWSILSPGVITKGTKVDSYYLHFDNKTYNDSLSLRKYLDPKNQISASGKVTFKKPVLGIVMRAYRGKKDFLGQSNEVVGLTQVEYCVHNFRHFPGANIADGFGSDHFTLSEDRLTLSGARIV